MLPLHFFANPSFTLANTALALMTFTLFGLVFMLTQYFQSVLDYEPFIAGIVQLPVAIAVMILSVMSAKIAHRFGTKRTVAAGAFLAGVALLYTRFIVDANTPYSLIFIGQVVFASGLGLMISPSTSSVMQSVPVRKSGIGSAMNDATRQVGGALGVAVMGSILNAIYRENLTQLLDTLPQPPEALRETLLRSIQGAHMVASQLPDHAQAIIEVSKAAFVTGMQQALLIAAIVMFVAAILTLLFLPDHPKRLLEISDKQLRDQGDGTMVPNIQMRSMRGPSDNLSAGARLTLMNREILRLNPLPAGIRVISGCVWVSWKGKDIVLTKGQEIKLSRGGDIPVVSAECRMALTFDILEKKIASAA